MSKTYACTTPSKMHGIFIIAHTMYMYYAYRSRNIHSQNIIFVALTVSLRPPV